MIKIRIETNGKGVYDSFQHENTTFQENALILRRLEEIKLELLSIQYESNFEVFTDNEDDNFDGEKEEENEDAE